MGAKLGACCLRASTVMVLLAAVLAGKGAKAIRNTFDSVRRGVGLLQLKSYV
jgi:hypothetical protein